MDKPIKDQDPMKAMLVRYWWQEPEDEITVYATSEEDLLQRTVQDAVTELRRDLESKPTVPPKPRPDFLRVAQVAELYGVAPIRTLRDWIFTDYHGLASRCVTRKGRNVLINRIELEKWIKEQDK